MNQVRVRQEQTVPPCSPMLLKCYLRKTPWLNAEYYIDANTLDRRGVLVGNALVKLQADGSFPLPIINMTSEEYTVRPNKLLGIASPGVRYAHQPAEKSSPSVTKLLPGPVPLAVKFSDPPDEHNGELLEAVKL